MSFASRLFSAFLLLAVSAPMGMAQDSEVVFSRKAWQVEVVGFDDGTYGCVAHVTHERGSFSIWIFQDDTARLQFFSDAWGFEGGTDNFEVQIDKRGPWTLTNAELYQQSILFNLPNSDDGQKFVAEVAAGNNLVLKRENGKLMRKFSLAGSAASMLALGECGETIVQEAASSGGGAVAQPPATQPPAPQTPPPAAPGPTGQGGQRANPFQ